VFDPVVAELEATVGQLRAIIAAQAEVIAELRSRVEPQETLISELRSRLEELQSDVSRDSATSSLPPSRDGTDRRARRAAEAKARREERRAGMPARKPGKQPGAPGATQQRREPTKTVLHEPADCGRCGGPLEDAPVTARATRQVLEIPEPTLEAVDHVAVTRRCECGTETSGAFPPEATGPVCWGPRARATGAYLLGRQHLALQRGAEAMADLFAAPMGEGTLAGLLPEAANRLGGFTDTVADLVKASPFVHADETSVRVDVDLAWVHTASTPELTHLALHERRGIDAIADIGVLTNYTGTIVHDGLATYDSGRLAKATHAQCCSHLIRSLKDLARSPSQDPWAHAMIGVLVSARDASLEAAVARLGAVPDGVAIPIRERYGEILTQALLRLPGDVPPDRKHRGGWTTAERDAWNLATRMRRHEDQVLRVLDDTRIPFTNNTGERSFRFTKLHDKISGTFRSWSHAEAFLAVRSYLGTGAKQGMKAMDLLIRLWTPEGAWLPSVVASDGT
jgi:transposase